MSHKDITPVDGKTLLSTDIPPPNLTRKDDAEAQKLQHQDGCDSPTLNQMRWFQMICLLAVIIIIPIACIIAFCITKSPYCFVPCGALIAHVWKLATRVTNWLFPQDAKDFYLEITKVFKMHRNKPPP